MGQADMLRIVQKTSSVSQAMTHFPVSFYSINYFYFIVILCHKFYIKLLALHAKDAYILIFDGI